MTGIGVVTGDTAEIADFAPRANKVEQYTVREKRTDLIAEEESVTTLATVVR